MLKYTLDDIQKNPKAYGAPTFDEFQKDPEKWRIGAGLNTFAQADNGSSLLSNVKEQIYYIGGKLTFKERIEEGKRLKMWQYSGGIKTKVLEKISEEAQSMGWQPKDIEMIGNLEKTTAGKFILHVYFEKKGHHGGEEGEGTPQAFSGGSREGA